jgi:hypothetical protein
MLLVIALEAPNLIAHGISLPELINNLPHVVTLALEFRAAFPDRQPGPRFVSTSLCCKC